MRLLIDIGNTRIKWGVADKTARLLCGNAVAHNNAEWAGQLQAANSQYAFQSAVLACGRNDDLYNNVVAVLQSLFAIPIERFYSQARMAGVSNAYRDPSQLGPDRWAAMIAAHALYKGSLLVCSCGTAATLDVLDKHGLHQGGYILPGLSMSRQAIQTVNLPAVDGGDLRPAVATNAAIANGSLLQLVAAISYIIEHQKSTQCILTGGDAIFVKSFLDYPVHCEPELVLKGMAIAAVSQ